MRIAVEMVKEKLIDETTALKRVSPDSLNHLLLPQLDPKAKVAVVAKGIAASPGAACGKVILSAEAAVAYHEEHPDDPILLVRKETSPEDVAGMHLAKGILTATGGKASHAAVVARGWGKPCVVGCDAIADRREGRPDHHRRQHRQGRRLPDDQRHDRRRHDRQGADRRSRRSPAISPTLMTWADKVRTLKVRTNADTPEDAAKARSFGAEGIGLCRTEHMFFEGQRIVDMRKMILADDEAGRKKALAALEPYQKQDFIGIFEAMDGLPVTIRLLDPPLHEFLPHDEAGQAEVARQLGIPIEKVKRRVEQLHEANPMLGLRGCRLPIKFPEIGDMQVRAIIEAAIEVKKKGKTVLPEIMIPLIGTVEELIFLKKRASAVAEEVFAKAGAKVDFLIGTMIEIPRAALTPTRSPRRPSSSRSAPTT